MNNSFSHLQSVIDDRMPADGGSGTRRMPADGGSGTRRMPADGGSGTR
jgi:hypothetical protein